MLGTLEDLSQQGRAVSDALDIIVRKREMSIDQVWLITCEKPPI